MKDEMSKSESNAREQIEKIIKQNKLGVQGFKTSEGRIAGRIFTAISSGEIEGVGVCEGCLADKLYEQVLKREKGKE